MRPLAAIALLLLASPAMSVEIDGMVCEVRGNSAVIVVGSNLPAVGDQAAIFFEMPNTGDEVAVGTARVSEIGAESVQVTIETQTGSVARDQMVRISSANPTKRTTGSQPPSIGQALVCPDAEPPAGTAVAQNCFGNDRGAAGIRCEDHYYWAQKNPEQIAANLKYKIDLLMRCPTMSKEQLDSAFADISVVIPRYVMKNQCFGGDPHVTGLQWQPHKDWASQRTRDQVLNNLQWKVAAALKCLDSIGQINFFADSSCAVAKAPLGLGGDTAQAAGPGTVQPVSGSTKGCVGFAGKWNTDIGEMFLHQTGDRVTGNYVSSYGPGRISGLVTGRVFDGDWASTRTGKMQATLSEDGNSFRATWTAADGSSGSYGGTCAGPPPAIADTRTVRTPAAGHSAQPAPTTPPADKLVTVPDFSVAGNAAEIKSVAEQSGLVLALAAASIATPSKDLEFRAESQNPIAGTKVKKGSAVTVAIYQQYQEPQVIVPDLKAVATVDDMETALDKVGLKGAFTAATVATPSKDLEFKAQSQDPAAGTKAKKDSTVTVAIYQQYQEPEVTVPDLKGTGIAEIKATLDEAGLKGAFSAAAVAAPSKDLEFKAESQSPAAGTRVKKHSTVTVAVYQQYQEPEVTVPDLKVFATVDDMEAALDEAGLNGVFTAASVVTPSKEQEFRVESQDPAPGTKVKKDSTVTVAIYQQYQEPEVIVPDMRAFDSRDAMQAELDRVGLKANFIAASIPTPSKELESKAQSQQPAAGSKVKKDSTVTVAIYQPFVEPVPTAPAPATTSRLPAPTRPAAQSEPPSPVATPTPTPVIGPPRYLGCFKDQGAAHDVAGRDLDGAMSSDGGMTSAMCVEECRAQGFAYAGTQYSNYCFCGNRYGTSGPADNCDMPCAGNSSEICGGSWANSVYATGVSTPQIARARKPKPSRRQPAVATPSMGCVGFDGRWQTNYGVMTLAQSGNSVSGTYDWRDQNSSISGTVSGNVLSGSYSQPWHSDPRWQSGDVEFTLNGEAWQATRCTDAYDGNCGGSWSGTCLGPVSGVEPVPPVDPTSQPAPSGNIEVVAGTYGGNCPREQFGNAIDRGNVTAHLASACNGKESCDYTVDHTVIGDPAYGCVKTYVAEWRCGGDSAVHQAQPAAEGEAGYGSIVSLSCGPAAGASSEPTAASGVE
jgi:beta-lactam-binding protein with PASTA domain